MTIDNPIQLESTLFGKTSMYSDTTQLGKFVHDHPYCAIAQFYLFSRLHQDENNSHRDAQASKTALFFPNTKWLDYQLHLMATGPTEEGPNNNPEQIRDIKDEAQEIVPAFQPATERPLEKIHEQSIAGPVTEEPVLIPNSDDNGPLIMFEPLHTVDYFASQGIRISDQGVPGDKLGNQLKSFTEWLKSMKNVHSQSPKEVSQGPDDKIQTLAEASNSGQEVITEAMAEVLAKQGKYEKAIETYHKLSLIYPLKSGYFAAKINNLKGS